MSGSLAVAYVKGGRIGDPFKPAALPPLRRALTTALLQLNPPRRCPIRGSRSVAATSPRPTTASARLATSRRTGTSPPRPGSWLGLHGGSNVLAPKRQRFPRSPDLD